MRVLTLLEGPVPVIGLATVCGSDPNWGAGWTLFAIARRATARRAGIDSCSCPSERSSSGRSLECLHSVKARAAVRATRVLDRLLPGDALAHAAGTTSGPRGASHALYPNVHPGPCR